MNKKKVYSFGPDDYPWGFVIRVPFFWSFSIFFKKMMRIQPFKKKNGVTMNGEITNRIACYDILDTT
jgi:hypothetical protein